MDPRGEFGDFPAEKALNTSVRRILTDENSERETEEVEEVEEKRRPMNILLFYADDWCHDMLGAAGNPIVKTPVLDAIAAEEGVRFSKNCITMSICWISRTTLYCGQYLARHHLVMP
jgi:hypothetical protein